MATTILETRPEFPSKGNLFSNTFVKWLIVWLAINSLIVFGAAILLSKTQAQVEKLEQASYQFSKQIERAASSNTIRFKFVDYKFSPILSLNFVINLNRESYNLRTDKLGIAGINLTDSEYENLVKNLDVNPFEYYNIKIISSGYSFVGEFGYNAKNNVYTIFLRSRADSLAQ